MPTIDTSLKLVEKQQNKHGESITEIPRKIYSHFYKQKIGNEIKTETHGEIRLWCEIYSSSEKPIEKVIAIFTEEFDGDSSKTKFALSTWHLPEEELRASYEFEIIAEPQEGGWSSSTGNSFKEGMYYQTKNHTHDKPVPANHPIAKYIILALTEMRKFLMNPSIVCHEFIDNAPKPPR